MGQLAEVMIERKVEAGGVTLVLDTWGDGAVPVVVLHGFTGSAAAMRGLTERLVGCRVAAVDLVGHGRSDAPTDIESYTAATQVRHLEAIVRVLEADQVDVVGYSMGARLALTLAHERPPLVRRLALIGGTAGVDEPGARAERVAADNAIADRIEHEGIEAFVRRWEDIPLFASQRSLPPERQLEIRAERLAQRPTGLANSLRGFGAGAMPPVWGSLSEITTPTLAIAGALDAKFSALANRLAALLPRCEVAAIPGAGHAAHVEAPQAVADAVHAHLRP